MDVSVRELRNHTGRVVKALESGQTIVLTVDGRAIADIVPRSLRAERRSSDVVLRELAEIAQIADSLGVFTDASDYDTGLTTDRERLEG